MKFELGLLITACFANSKLTEYFEDIDELLQSDAVPSPQFLNSNLPQDLVQTILEEVDVESIINLSLTNRDNKNLLASTILHAKYAYSTFKKCVDSVLHRIEMLKNSRVIKLQ